MCNYYFTKGGIVVYKCPGPGITLYNLGAKIVTSFHRQVLAPGFVFFVRFLPGSCQVFVRLYNRPGLLQLGTKAFPDRTNQLSAQLHRIPGCIVKNTRKFRSYWLFTMMLITKHRISLDCLLIGPTFPRLSPLRELAAPFPIRILTYEAKIILNQYLNALQEEFSVTLLVVWSKLQYTRAYSCLKIKVYKTCIASLEADKTCWATWKESGLGN